MNRIDEDMKSVLANVLASNGIVEESDIVFTYVDGALTVTKSPDDLDLTDVRDPYIFAQNHNSYVIAIIQEDGAFYRYNHKI